MSLDVEIGVHAVEALRAGGEPFLLLDCREPDEHAIVRIEGALLIPMRTIPERLRELEPHREARIVVHCHHGVRSLRVARFLRERGFAGAQSMTGGIEAWSLEIDPAMPRY
jgi:rhodanese-related sulfurtransferase